MTVKTSAKIGVNSKYSDFNKEFFTILIEQC